MDELLNEVEQRTNLAMSNEMEMLTFHLTDGQTYGLNVFKIIEILETPEHITRIPHSHPTIKGEIAFRGHAITLIDLAQYLGLQPVALGEEISYVLVCEYSGTTQGFLVSQPDVLITKNWEEIIRPENPLYQNSCLTAFTYHRGKAIQILDVEKILVEIIGVDFSVSDNLLQRRSGLTMREHHVLAVDDSMAACRLIEKTLDQLGIRHAVFNDARKALKTLEDSVAKGGGKSHFTLILTDLEMPGMDGFTFTRKVKANPQLADIHLVVHSSLSNKSNLDRAKRVGADDFISKFKPDNIVSVVLDLIEKSVKS